MFNLYLLCVGHNHLHFRYTCLLMVKNGCLLIESFNLFILSFIRRDWSFSLILSSPSSASFCSFISSSLFVIFDFNMLNSRFNVRAADCSSLFCFLNHSFSLFNLTFVCLRTFFELIVKSDTSSDEFHASTCFGILADLLFYVTFSIVLRIYNALDLASADKLIELVASSYLSRHFFSCKANLTLAL